MSLERFQQPVTTAEELVQLIGTPSELVIKKQLSELDDHMRHFIAESPFLLLGTFGRDGILRRVSTRRWPRSGPGPGRQDPGHSRSTRQSSRRQPAEYP